MAQPLPQSGDEREDRAAAIAAAVTAIFAAAEAALATSIAMSVRKLLAGMAATPSAATAAGGTEAAGATIGRRLSRQAASVLASAIRRAAQVITGTGLDPPPEALMAALERASRTAVSSSASIYQQVVAAALAEVQGKRSYLPLSLNRIKAAQKALDELAGNGITGFTDSAGRNWDLASYVEMATRTAVSNAYDEAVTGALRAAGHDLVLVTHGMEPICARCAPFLGHLLSLGGATTGTVEIQDSTGGTRSAVVMATVAEAKAAGWRHPNCRCGMVPWHDGVNLSGVDAFEMPAPDVMAARYKAEQKQRRLERRVRAAGRRYQAAVTRQARTQARRDLAAARAASSAHRTAHGVRMTRRDVRRREHPFRAR